MRDMRNYLYSGPTIYLLIIYTTSLIRLVAPSESDR